MADHHAEEQLASDDNSQPAGPPHTRIDLRVNRRDILKRAVALGLSAPVLASLLAACGGDDDDDDDDTSGAQATPTTSGQTSPTSAAGSTPSVAGGGTTTTSGAEGGTLVIGRNIDDLITFDQAVVYEISSAPINYAVYETLIFQDPNDLTRYVPVLCEEVPTTENGGVSDDGLTYTFKIKQGITFHTGGTMTAHDWVFAFKRLWYGKKNPSFLAGPFSEEDTVNAEAVDDQTLKLTLISPNAAFFAYLASLNMGVYDSAFVKEQGGLDTPAAETDDTAKEWLDQNSAGTGPYKLTSFKNKEEVVLERFADYWGPKPAFEKIVFKQIVDSGTQLQQLEGGAIQIAMELDGDAIKSLDSGKFDVVEGNSLNHTYLALHNGEDVGGILADVRVRQAVAYAIDYDAYVNDLRGGAAVRPAGPVPLGLQGADKVEPKKYVRDVAKATQLIKDAGVEGETITFTFGSGGAYDGVPNETSAAKLQADIQEIGLKVELNPMEPQQRLQDYRDAKLQFTISSWAPDYVDVHTYAFPFGGVPDQAPSSRIAYVNEENVKLLEEGIAEQDPVKREEIYVAIQESIVNDAGFPVLWQPVFQYAVDKSVTGIRIHPVALLILQEIRPA